MSSKVQDEWQLVGSQITLTEQQDIIRLLNSALLSICLLCFADFEMQLCKLTT